MERHEKDEVTQIVREAVACVFDHLGIDMGDPREMKSIQKDFAYLRMLRKGSELVKATTITTCVGALVTGAIAAVVLGVRAWLQTKQ